MTSPTYLPRPAPEAESKVAAPAIAIMVMAGLSIAVALLGLLVNVLGIGVGALGRLREEERVVQFLSGGLGLVINVLSLVLNSFAIFGGMKMKALQSYAMSVASAVIVALPCVSCCCLIGTPIGIWALVVLLSADVKAAFRS